MLKGKPYELELAKMLRDKGFAVVHSAGSGGCRRSWCAPDLVAVRYDEKHGVHMVLAIEVKKVFTKPCVYFNTKEFNALFEWYKRASAFAVVALRAPNKKWYFVPLHKVVCTRNNCRACINDAESLLEEW